jgi:peptide chain release factor 3
MQFEVVEHRMAREFSAPVALERLPYSLARRTDPAGALALAADGSVEVLARDGDRALLALFPDSWRVSRVQRDLPEVLLEPLVAAAG